MDKPIHVGIKCTKGIVLDAREPIINLYVAPDLDTSCKEMGCYNGHKAESMNEFRAESPWYSCHPEVLSSCVFMSDLDFLSEEQQIEELGKGSPKCKRLSVELGCYAAFLRKHKLKHHIDKEPAPVQKG